MRFCLVCGGLLFLIIGANEHIMWLVWPALLALGVVALLLRVGESAAVAFHGHGDTRSRAVTHERRHVRVLDGLGVGATRPKVWETRHGWAGVVYALNKARWNALSPDEQAAVYIAGSPSLGRQEDFGCSDDLAHVDALSTRSRARRIARRYV